ncbi:hypothetical protein ONE63_001079 [Megalurothrips usitatus]|nr:hypothetical protein ONE63_001079 [Megalurothrips usitatus]
MVPKFAVKTQLIADAANASKPFVWTQDHVDAVRAVFDEIKGAVLYHFDFDRKTRLETDASVLGLSGALYQKHGAIFLPYSFWSRKTTPAEQKLMPFALEVLAAAEAVTHWRAELKGIEFQLITDCSGLTAILKMKNPGPKLARCIAALSEFSIQYVFRKGSENASADPLSRDPDPLSLPSLPFDAPALPDDILAASLQAVSSQLVPNLALEQDRDEEIRTLRQSLLDANLSDRRTRRFQLIDGAVYTKGSPPAPYVPLHLRPALLAESHSSLFAGHFAAAKTIERLQNFYWPSLRKDATDYCRSCDDCQRRNYKGHKEGRLTPIVSRHPQDIVTLDVKYCPLSTSGHKYLSVFVCNYTHFAAAFPMRSLTVAETLECVKQYIFTFGCFRKLICDLGSNYTAQSFRDFSRSLGVELVYAPVYHHTTSGLAEALIKSISGRLSAFCQDKLERWPEYVLPALFAVNTSVRFSLSVSPFQLLFGYNPLLPSTIALCLPQSLSPVDKLRRHFELRVQAEAHLRRAHEAQKRYYDNCRRHVVYKRGQQVLVFRRSPKHAAKFRYAFHGPYRVCKRTGLSSYLVRIRDHGRMKRRKFHVQCMKPYLRRTPLLPPELVTQVPFLTDGSTEDPAGPADSAAAPLPPV